MDVCITSLWLACYKNVFFCSKSTLFTDKTEVPVVINMQSTG